MAEKVNVIYWDAERHPVVDLISKHCEEIRYGGLLLMLAPSSTVCPVVSTTVCPVVCPVVSTNTTLYLLRVSVSTGGRTIAWQHLSGGETLLAARRWGKGGRREEEGVVSIHLYSQ